MKADDVSTHDFERGRFKGSRFENSKPSASRPSGKGALRRDRRPGLLRGFVRGPAQIPDLEPYDVTGMVDSSKSARMTTGLQYVFNFTRAGYHTTRSRFNSHQSVPSPSAVVVPPSPWRRRRRPVVVLFPAFLFLPLFRLLEFPNRGLRVDDVNAGELILEIKKKVSVSYGHSVGGMW